MELKKTLGYIDLTPEQQSEKKILTAEAKIHSPNLAEYFIDLVVDFVVRNPEECARQRESREWEQEKSKYAPDHFEHLKNI